MSLARHAKSAVIWNAGYTIFSALLQFVVMCVLVRILKPEAYGQFNLVTSIMGFITMFAFNNFLAYTVQVREEKDAHWQEHFTAGAFFQIGMFVVTNLVAFGLRWFPKYSPVEVYVHVMSLVFLLDWPNALRAKMLERQFAWERLRTLHGIGLLGNMLLAVGMALVGCGVYALFVPGLMVTLPVIYDLFFVQRWRPTWAWSWEKYRPAWRFGLTRTFSGVAIRGQQLIESMVLVAWIGFAELGIYARALALAQKFCGIFTEQLLAAIYPVLTRVDPDPRNVSRVGGLVLRLVAWVVIPVGVIFSALAQPVIHTVYGVKWLAAVPLLPWAMLLGVLDALRQTMNQLMLSRNLQKRCMYADFFLVAGNVLALLAGLPQGLLHYLAALVLVQAGVFVLLLVWLIQAGGLQAGSVTRSLLPPLAAGLAAWLVCKLALRVSGADLNRFPVAFAYGVIFGLGYLAGLRLAFTGLLRELMPYVPGKKFFCLVLQLPAN